MLRNFVITESKWKFPCPLCRIIHFSHQTFAKQNALLGILLSWPCSMQRRIQVSSHLSLRPPASRLLVTMTDWKHGTPSSRRWRGSGLKNWRVVLFCSMNLFWRPRNNCIRQSLRSTSRTGLNSWSKVVTYYDNVCRRPFPFPVCIFKGLNPLLNNTILRS